MHYFSFNIGDYRKKTDHLTPIEDLAYRRLLELYYDTESPITDETQSVSRRLRLADYTEVVENILKEFFILENGFWHSKRCDEEIKAYKHKAKVNKINGMKGGRRPNPVATQSVSLGQANGKPTTNHKPLTTNQVKEEKKIVSKRSIPIPDDWNPNEKHIEKARTYKLDLDLQADKFRNYCQANGKKYKDHNAAFNNWLITAHGYENKNKKTSNGIMRRVL